VYSGSQNIRVLASGSKRRTTGAPHAHHDSEQYLVEQVPTIVDAEDDVVVHAVCAVGTGAAVGGCAPG
jgi:hypothetical protein